jgi:hypothetical protein
LPHLRADLLVQVFTSVQRIADGPSIIEALASLAPYLPVDRWQEISVLALTTTQAISDEQKRAQALRALIPSMPEEQLPQVLAIAQTMKDSFGQAEVLRELIQRLPAALRPQVLQIAQTISDPDQRLLALGGLDQTSPDDQQDAVYGQEPATSETTTRDYMQALAAAQMITDDYERAQALIELAPELLAEQQRTVYSQVLRSCEAIHDDYRQNSVLEKLVPNLPLEVLPDLLQFMEGRDSRSNHLVWDIIIARLVALLPASLTVVGNIADEHRRAEAVEQLIPDVLVIVQTLGEEVAFDRALSGLIPHLSLDLLFQLVPSVQTIFTEVLASLPNQPPLDEQLLYAQMLAAPLGIATTGWRNGVLRTLAPRLTSIAGHSPEGGRAFCLMTLRVLADTKRAAFMQGLPALAPWLAALASPQQLTEIATSITNVARCWP